MDIQVSREGDKSHDTAGGLDGPNLGLQGLLETCHLETLLVCESAPGKLQETARRRGAWSQRHTGAQPASGTTL